MHKKTEAAYREAEELSNLVPSATPKLIIRPVVTNDPSRAIDDILHNEKNANHVFFYIVYHRHRNV